MVAAVVLQLLFAAVSGILLSAIHRGAMVTVLVGLHRPSLHWPCKESPDHRVNL